MPRMWSEEGRYLSGEEPYYPKDIIKPNRGVLGPQLSDSIKWASENPDMAKYDQDGNPIHPEPRGYRRDKEQ